MGMELFYFVNAFLILKLLVVAKVKKKNKQTNNKFHFVKYLNINGTR